MVEQRAGDRARRRSRRRREPYDDETQKLISDALRKYLDPPAFSRAMAAIAVGAMDGLEDAAEMPEAAAAAIALARAEAMRLLSFPDQCGYCAKGDHHLCGGCFCEHTDADKIESNLRYHEGLPEGADDG